MTVFCARRRLRQWHLLARAVFPVVVDRPAMLGIMAGMHQRDSYVASLVQTAENCGFFAVAAHHGCRHFLRDAEAHPHGPCDHRFPVCSS